MNNIEQILKDIYEMDSSLKEHDSELRGILKELIEVRPDIQLDEKFVQSLRMRLGERAQALGNKGTVNGWVMKLAFGLAGPAVIGILFLITTRLPVNMPAVFETGITTVGPHAFDLSGVTTGEAPASAKEAFAARTEITPVNNVGGSKMIEGEAVGTADSAEASAPAIAVAPDIKMMPPYPGGESVSYRYVYDGKLPTLTESQMAVFRRLPASVSDRAFTSALKNLDFGLLDIGRFDSLKAEYMSFLEDKKYGYGIQISFTEGVININQNWNKWPNPYNECTDDACYQRLALKAGDVPSDEAVIEMADTFLKEHGISLKNYGSAVVQHYETPLYRAEDGAAETMPVYIPEYLTLIYPERVDGKDVTEGDGSPSGLSVSFSVRDKKVTSVNNLRAGDFEKSLYDTETDTASLLSWAGKGGVNYWEYSDPAAKEVEIKLGEPEIVYYKFYKWDQANNRNEEYLIPAYSFSIEKTEDYQSYRKYILVPLIRGLEGLDPDRGTGPIPRPLMTK